MKKNRLFFPALLGVSLLSIGITYSAKAQNTTSDIGRSDHLSFEQNVDSADYYLDKGNWLKAEDFLVSALKMRPAAKANWLLWSNLGVAREQRGEYASALQAYEIGLGYAPKSTVLHENRARIHMQTGNIDEAIGDLSNALKVDSTLQWARKMRGLLSLSVGQPERGLEDLEFYQKKWGMDPSIEEAKANLAVSKGDTESALEHYKNSLQMNLDKSVATKALLTAAFSGKLDEWKPDLDRFMDLWPDTPEFYLVKALHSKNTYQTTQMESALRRARELGIDNELVDKMFPVKK